MSLADKRKLYPNMPEVEYLPMGKNVLIYRIEGAEKTAGGIFIPEEHKEIRSRGILLAAGLKARDIMADALIEIGDEVYCGRFSGDDRETKDRKEGSARKTLWEAVVDDIHGSVEALERFKDHDIVVNTDDEGNQWRTYEKKKGRAA